MQRGRRGRDASYPAPPAQIPACGFSAPGSSVRLASAILVSQESALPLREVGLCAPALHVRHTLPLRATSPVSPFPLWTALPPSEYSAVSRLRALVCRPPGGGMGIPALGRNAAGLPRSERFSLGMPGPEDPTAPPASGPPRCLWVGGRCVQPVAVGLLAITRLYQTAGCAVTPPAAGSRCTLPRFRAGLLPLLHIGHTRYGWLARPYPVRSFTSQETPGFASRTKAAAQPRLEAGAQRTL